MKKNILTSSFSMIFAVCAISIIFSSCKKEASTAPNATPNDKQLYELFLRAGIDPDHIEDIGEYYVIEDDMRFKKNKTNLSKASKYFGIDNKNGKEIKTYQWRTPEVISSANADRIKVSSNISVPYTIMDQAFNNWANIADCKINFYGIAARGVGDDNSIYVFHDNSINAYAQAEFPNDDEAGYRIRVNSNLFNPLSDAQKLYILTHEIGHCLGLRHSDLNTNGEGSSGAYQIPGTPVNDPSSIMNSGSYHSVVPSFSGMTYYDKAAVQYLYPYSNLDKWIIYPTNKYPDVEVRITDFDQPVNITWNKDLVQTSTVTIELYQFNQLIGVIGQNIPNSGTYSYPVALYAHQEGYYAFDLCLKIISDNNPQIFDYSHLFRTWNLD